MPTMDKRRYVQTTRASSAEMTRQRVLEAARASLERGPVGALKVDEVARVAGVSRSTVYLLYGSRAGLFDALARHLRDESGFEHLIEAFRRPDALEALRTSQYVAVGMYAVMPSLARALFTLAAIDPDAVAAVRAIEDGRRPGMTSLARRLDAQGYLRPGVTVAEAADILTVITSFQSFDELYTGSERSAEVVAERLTAMSERAICRDGLPDWSPPESLVAGVSPRPRPGSRRPGDARSRASRPR
jgi:AcrR family transcriptional regulator